MSPDDFAELKRLFEQVHVPPGPDGWSSETRHAVSARLEGLLQVWLDDPLTSANFRRSANKWVLGRGPVRPIVAVQRKMRFEFDGVIEFTVNWGVWVKPFAQQLEGSKRPSPSTSTAPFASRIGDLLESGEDVWWAVAQNGVIRITSPPRLEADVQTPHDDVPRIVRNELIPMLAEVTTIRAAISAIEQWSARGLKPSTSHVSIDPLTALRRLIERTDVDATQDVPRSGQRNASET